MDRDDAGATIDDKEDSLWRPQGLVLVEKEAKKQTKQKMKTFEDDETKSGKQALGWYLQTPICNCFSVSTTIMCRYSHSILKIKVKTTHC